MRIVCAPDSFKETLSASEVAAAMAEGVRQARPDARVDRCPIADGGEGSLAVFVEATGGALRTATVTGPQGESVRARYGVVEGGRIGVVEMAEASGLTLVPAARRDPTRTTSYGTGELIRRAAGDGCDTVIVFVGGSATCDGGAGIAQALGVTFRDGANDVIAAPMTGGRLADVRAVTRPPPAPPVPRLIVAADVTNPLTGPSGAAAVYGPQKGATPAQVAALDAALANLARCAGADPALADAPGSGAAGGAGYGLAALCGATLRRGVDVVLDAVGLERRCRGAALVLTGEGRLDAQSLDGKACLAVAGVARRAGAPTVAIVGTTGPGAEACFDRVLAVESLDARYGLERALGAPAPLIRDTVAERLAAWLPGAPPGERGR